MYTYPKVDPIPKQELEPGEQAVLSESLEGAIWTLRQKLHAFPGRYSIKFIRMELTIEERAIVTPRFIFFVGDVT